MNEALLVLFSKVPKTPSVLEVLDSNNMGQQYDVCVRNVLRVQQILLQTFGFIFYLEEMFCFGTVYQLYSTVTSLVGI